MELSDNWKFRIVTDTIIPGLDNDFHEAYVPGCVHTDLYKNNIIDDPFYRDNESKLQWIENMDWEYLTSFDVDNTLFKKNNIEIEFKGLDTYADVYLNDSLILTSDNMFRSWSLDCKKYLNRTQNTLRIVFHSPIGIEKRKRDSTGFDLPDIRAFTRKAPYQYGWDWAPRFVTAGIWRPVIITGWDKACIEDLYIVNNMINEDSAQLSIELEVLADDSMSCNLHLSVEEEDKRIMKFDNSYKLLPGQNRVKMELKIDDPKLWWPNGMGEPFLYFLSVELSSDGGILDKRSRRFGLRNIELLTEKDSIGESFYFSINETPFFIKGANYIPQSSFPAEVKEGDYEFVINSAKDANMNMLRVWGGGIYENDIFYDLCDEKGILVWQDFMFACNMYPGDYHFLENVRLEAIENVKRLRNHPCIALWCGNNEVDEGWHNWGWQELFNYTKEQNDIIWTSYKSIFHRLLPVIIKNFDPQKPYWPSSPKHGWGHEESMREGDSHYWGVWWGEEPFDIYTEKVGRFMSEYGFQGYPDISTVKKFTIESDRTVDSEVMKVHQKHPRGIELINTYMARDYKIPGSFEDFLYVSQLLQAEGIKTAIEAHRRAKLRCMGTLYWQLNDCWPVASWSGIDYYGRWKALHYFVRDAYRTFLVSVDERDDMLDVYVVSDSVNAIDATLDLRILTFEGKEVYKKDIDIMVPPSSSNIYYSINRDVVPHRGTTSLSHEVVIVLNLSHGNKVFASNVYYFSKPKDLNLKAVNINSKISQFDDHWQIELSTDYLAKNVYLQVEGDDGFFDDNYFDLLPFEKKMIKYYPEKHKIDLEDTLIIMSLVDDIR